jgi:hypothetical protein
MKRVRRVTRARAAASRAGTAPPMSTVHEHEADCARSYTEARQRKLRRILETYGVLTREHLRELAHADRWRVPFDVALARAVRSGRVRRLTRDLFEAGPKR